MEEVPDRIIALLLELNEIQARALEVISELEELASLKTKSQQEPPSSHNKEEH